MNRFFKNIGPGVLITAAFIGPGTVTVCLLAGNQYLFSLLWALVFATLATIILQEMSARLGLITGKGLGEAISLQLEIKWVRIIAICIIIAGILLGNAAYEAGNISGTLIGIRLMVSDGGPDLFYTALVYISAFLLLYFGTYKMIEKFFIGIVFLMSLSFIAAACISKPDLKMIFLGSFIPTFPEGSIITIIGLIGTTIVPYNLFLHSSMIKKKWNDVKDLSTLRKDTVISIALGGIISASILITGASTFGIPVLGIGDLSTSFESIYGNTGRYLFGFGIAAAGFTSTITAPLAAGLVARGLFQWSEEAHENRMRFVWILVLTVGFVFASMGYKPIEIIKIAQFANGLLLPLIAAFLIYVVNKKQLMGEYVNSKTQNILGFIVLLVSIILGIKGIMAAI